MLVLFIWDISHFSFYAQWFRKWIFASRIPITYRANYISRTLRLETVQCRLARSLPSALKSIDPQIAARIHLIFAVVDGMK